MGILKKVKEKFKYPQTMEEEIIQHEEKIFKYYSEVISKKYGELFQRNDCNIYMKLIWVNDLKRTLSEQRIKMELGYSCYVDCEIQKDGKTVEIFLEEEDLGWYLLARTWMITRIDFTFNNPPYCLIDDTEEIYEDMDEFQELLSDRVSGIS